MGLKTVIAYPAYKNRDTNPYQALLYDELEKRGWRVHDLDSGVLRVLRPAIVHLHWPDGFAFHKSLCKTLFRSCLLLLLLSWYRMLGSRVVWTLHNLRSHEQFHPRIEALFWKRLYRRLDAWIALNSFSAETALGMPVLRTLPHAIIPHGLYPRLGNAAGKTESAPDTVQLLLFGKIRPYKEIPALLEAYAGLNDLSIRLTIAGQCHDDALRGQLEKAAKDTAGLRVIPRFIPDDELDALIVQSDIVVIPYAGSLNSGVIFLALAYEKTVIAPTTPTFEEIAADFGESAVRLFDPPLSADKLKELIAARPDPDESGPMPAELREGYAWSTIAAEHGRFFEEISD